MIVHTDKIAHELAQAKREWEEMDLGETSYDMRKAKETRYLTLLALSRQGAVEARRGPTPPRKAAGWKRQAMRVAR